MSTPDDKSAASTMEQQVNSLADKFVKGEDGKLALPEGTEASEELQYAARTEIRRRDTFSSFTREKNTNKSLAAENEALATGWEGEAINNLTSEQRTELDGLKTSDPDAWKTKIDEYKEVARTTHKEKRTKLTDDAKNETELDKRARLVEEYNEANPELQITQDLIDNDVPPRITNQLAKGEITFEEYIAKVVKYVSKDKVIDKGKGVDEKPDFDKAGGSSIPDEDAVARAAASSYEKEIF